MDGRVEQPGWIVRLWQALLHVHPGALFLLALVVLAVGPLCRVLIVGAIEYSLLRGLFQFGSDLSSTIGYPLAVFAIGRVIADAIERRG